MNMRICTLCVMDESDPQITFNREGVCNHCLEAKKVVKILSINDMILANWTNCLKSSTKAHQNMTA